MNWKRTINIYFLAFIIFASNIYAFSFKEELKKFFSIHLSDEIFEKINKDIIGSLHAKNMKFYFPNRVTMDDVEVLDDKGKRVLYGKHAELKISLLSLMTNNIVVTDAFIEAPFFNYTINKRVHNVVRIFEDPDPKIKTNAQDTSSRIRVTIKHVRVQNGSYEMEHDVGLKIFAQGISAEGNFWVEKGPFGVNISEARIERGGIHVAGMDLPISQLVSRELFISDEKVSTKYLNALYEKASLTANGTVFIDKDHYEINAKLDAPQNTYPQGLKRLPFVTPSFTANVIMSGPLEKPEFKVDSHLGNTQINGVKIARGTAKCEINEHRVKVENSVFSVGERGKLSAQGVVDIDKDNFFFKSKQENINSKDLIKFLSLKMASSGEVDAQTTIEGQLDYKTSPIKILSRGNLKNIRLDKARLAGETNFFVSLITDASGKISFKELNFNDSKGSKVQAKGELASTMKNGWLSYELKWRDPKFYVNQWLPDDMQGEDLSSSGKINWQEKNIDGQAKIEAKNIDYKKIKIDSIKSEIKIAKNNLFLENISAQLYQGKVFGSASIQNIFKERIVKSSLKISNIDSALAVSRLTDLDLSGLLNIQLNLSGSLEKVAAQFFLQAQKLSFYGINIRTINLEGIFQDNKLEIPELFSQLDAGTIDGKKIVFGLSDKKISGSLVLSDLAIAPLLSRYAKVEGIVRGAISIGGSWLSPRILAKMHGKNIVVADQKLGFGPLTLSLQKERLNDGIDDEDMVLSLSSILQNNNAQTTIRTAVALNRKSINSTLSFKNFELDSSDIWPNKFQIGIKGKASAKLTAHGQLLSPKVDAQIEIFDYGFFDPRKRNAQIFINKKYGIATINANLDNEKLQVELCAPWTQSSLSKGCDFESGILAQAKGKLNQKGLSVELSGAVRHDHLENIIPVLNDELAVVGAEASIQGRLTKKFNQDMLYDFKLYLASLNAGLPNINGIKLVNPVSVKLKNKEISLNSQAEFLFSPGKMKISGSAKNNNLDIKINGAIPLVLSKFIVPIVQRGEGLALGDLNISGSFDSPILEGMCEPEQGAMLSFKKWIEFVEFKRGKVSFRKNSPHSFSTSFEKFKIGVGDGRLDLDGEIKKQYKIHGMEELTTFDVKIEGSNIILRDKNNFIETDFNLDTVKLQDKASVLSGKITLIDGSAHKQFDLRNFVIQASEGPNKDLQNIFGAIDLNLNLEIAVRQFRASMRMLNIDIETLLTGQLKVNGPISHSKFTGGLSVSEGAVNFPAATFDLGESRIELDELTQRSFDPKIIISSMQEFEKDSYPELSQDTTIELALKGNLDRLDLELKPINGDLHLNQSKIFLMLMMPRGIGGENNDTFPQNAKNAVVAFSGEVFLRPLTNELQNLLEGGTQTKIRFGSVLEPGGLTLRLNWELGSRIEIQGVYMFLSEDILAAGEDKLSLFGNYPFRDLKLKLLLLDHGALGPLYLESSFGASRYVDGTLEPRAKLRLSYRIFSQ